MKTTYHYLCLQDSSRNHLLYPVSSHRRHGQRCSQLRYLNVLRKRVHFSIIKRIRKCFNIGIFGRCGHVCSCCQEFREFGTKRCKLLSVGWVNNKVLLHSTGDYIQYPMINRNGKEYEKEYICIIVTLLYSRK